MNRNFVQKVIVPYFVTSAAAFYLLAATLERGTLIMTLNAVFIGTMASITVSYGSVLLPAIVGRKPYDGVRQMAIGILMIWAAYGLSVLASIYVRATDVPETAFLATAVGRWLAINGAIIQITAPDFGSDILYGRDRKLLWSGIIVGAMLAIAVFVIQDLRIFGETETWGASMEFSSSRRSLSSSLC